MKQIKGIALLILAMFFFSFIGVFSRFAGKDPFSVSFYRALFSMSIFFCIYVGLRKGAHGGKAGLIEKIKSMRLTKDKAGIIIPYGLCVGCTILTFICGYLYTTMANTVLLHYLMPVYVLLGSARITGEKILPRSVLGFLFGIAGVGIITGFDILKGASPRALLGDFLAFISGITYAGIILWTRKARLMDIDIIYFIFWGWAITCIFCLPFAMLFGDFTLSHISLISLLGLAIFSTILPFIVSNIAIKYLTAQASSIIAFSEAAFVIVWGILFYKESLTAATLIGAALIFFSIIVVSSSVLEVPEL